MKKLRNYLSSSIGRKQIVAITGLMLVGFVVAHLSGNLLMFKSPQAFNDYAKFLHSLGGLLWLARLGLLASVVAHIYFTIQLILENRTARKSRYDVSIDDGRSFATKTMRYSGPLLFFFIVVHLLDFTFPETFPRSSVVLGTDLGLYGVVFNAFTDPIRSIFYILAMIALGLHLNHGFRSVFQTLGIVRHDNKLVNRTGLALGIGVALLFSSIPVMALVANASFTPECKMKIEQSYGYGKEVPFKSTVSKTCINEKEKRYSGRKTMSCCSGNKNNRSPQSKEHRSKSYKMEHMETK